jgi:tetratricopeptide (TPR) repeat protein
MIFRLLAIFAFVSTSCATLGIANGKTPIDQIPMYGGMDRGTVPELKAADEKLIEGTTKEFGSREKASTAFVGRAFRLYQQDDLAGAMRRFNQAWILNPNNPEVYWGFGVVVYDQGDNCGSMKMMEKALALQFSDAEFLADAGHSYALCAVSDKALTASDKSARLAKATELFSQAAAKAFQNPYVYDKWSQALYWTGDYTGAWQKVAQMRKLGKEPHPKLLKALQEKMPEPTR